MDEVCCAVHGIDDPRWVVSQSEMLSFHSRFFTNKTVDKYLKLHLIIKIF